MIPDFMKSEYFVPEPDNWHMREDAPPELVEQFREWMKQHDQPGMIVD